MNRSVFMGNVVPFAEGTTLHTGVYPRLADGTAVHDQKKECIMRRKRV